MKFTANLLKNGMIYYLTSVFLIACQPQDTIKNGRVLKNFRILTLENENILEDNVMIIGSDTILDILSEKEFHKRYNVPDSLVINGKGKYIMPSFHEMHAHLQPRNPNHKKYLRHYLAYGITDMRIMAGSEQLLSWKDSIGKGLILGPDLKVAGPLIDGEKPLWGKNHDGPVVSDVTKIDSIISDQEAKGYDLIKLYERLPKQVYLEFLKAAQERGIRVAGHIPFSLLSEPNLTELFNERSPSLEHFKNFGPLVTKQDIKKTEQPDDLFYYGYELALDPDPIKVRKVVEEINNSNTWICPTSVLWRNSSDSLMIAEIIDGDPFQRLDNGLKNWWLSTRGNTNTNQDVNDLTELFLREMARQNVKLLVGTDFPNPFLVPGYSVHQEIHILVEMGYSNIEALKAATIYPALYWNEMEHKGYIRPGRIANLLILKQNPLEKIENTLTIEHVIHKGQFLQPRELLKEKSLPAF